MATWLAGPTAALFALVLLARPASAHVGGLGGAGRAGPLPFWLIAMTGGGIVAVSFLFTSLMTDHATLREVNRAALAAPALGRRIAAPLARALGIAVLGVVLVSGLAGPREATRNAAILVVWVGWWAGYTASVYLVGNTWPLVNPWRTLVAFVARLVARAGVDVGYGYPDWGRWPAAVGLVGLVWIEVVSPVAADPRLLALAVLAYTAVTLAGALAVGPETWFGRVDPVALVFRHYGWLAPVQRTGDGLGLRLPGAALTERTVDGDGGVAFVVALVWVTTYDGLVATPAWNDLARAVVGAGVPALALYLVAIVAGFGLFLGGYRGAARLARRTAGSYVAPGAVARWFALSLVPIAAGYHLAHTLGYFLGLSPALVAALAAPLSGATDPVALVLPGWFTVVQLAFVVLGHLVAVWVAHALSFELFPGRLQPIRSQYPFILVMVFYTMTSMWIVSQPFAPPAYL